MPTEEPIKPIEINAPPFIYVVPSTFAFVRTEDTTDFYHHPNGGEFFVEHMTFTGGKDCSNDALIEMQYRAEDVSAVHNTPVLLTTGLAFMSYEEPSDDDASVTVYCELCGFFAPNKLGVVRYGSLLHRDDLSDPDVSFYLHLIRQYARLTRFSKIRQSNTVKKKPKSKNDTAKPSDSQIQKFIEWITAKALNGVPPLSSAYDLATEYRIDTSYHDNDDRVGSLINWETSKNFTSGFITGFGGLITLPISIPSAFGASWVIQARMSAAIALIYGHDLDSDRVRTLVLISLLGDAGKEVLKQAGVKVVQKITVNLIKRIPGKLLIEVNKKVGFRLITKAGEKGVVNLIKGVPAIGGIVGGAFDAAACRAVGSAAHSIFRR